MTAGKVETETITEGDGEELKGQDDVLAHLWIGNGYSQETAFSHLRREEGRAAHGQQPAAGVPRRHPRRQGRLADRGHRVGRGGVRRGRQLPARHRQQGHRPRASSTWCPRCRTSRRARSRRTRTGCRSRSSGTASSRASTSPAPPSPTDDLRRVQLIKGTGPRVKKGQTIAVRYLGQAFGGEKPFDENFGDDGDGRADHVQHRHRRGHQGLGPGARRRPGRLAGGARDPAGARLRRRGQPGQRHPGERHPGVHDRHPRRGLSHRIAAGMAGSGAWRRARASDCSTC